MNVDRMRRYAERQRQLAGYRNLGRVARRRQPPRRLEVMTMSDNAEPMTQPTPVELSICGNCKELISRPSESSDRAWAHVGHCGVHGERRCQKVRTDALATRGADLVRARDEIRDLRAEVERLKRQERGQTTAAKTAWRAADFARSLVASAEADRDDLRAKLAAVEAAMGRLRSGIHVGGRRSGRTLAHKFYYEIDAALASVPEPSDSEPESDAVRERAERLAGVVTHTRTSTPIGPDYCHDCSTAIGDWVKWPCEGSRRREPERCPHVAEPGSRHEDEDCGCVEDRAAAESEA